MYDYNQIKSLHNKLTTVLLLTLMLTALILAGCGSTGPDTVTFTAVVENVYESSIMVSTIDFDQFDKASVDLREAEYDFKLVAGQTVEITILPEIRESYPVQVTAVKIVLK